MTFLGNGGQTRDAHAFIQAWRVVRRSVMRVVRRSVLRVVRCSVLICLACVTGCSNYHTSGPEAWWHDSVGGEIAKERPPPPGDKDPYPNLATVPPKPAVTGAAVWNDMTAGLVTDRINALQAAALAPIPAAASPAAPARSSAATTQPPPGASVALVAATPPPATPAPGSGPPAQPKSSQPPPVLAAGNDPPPVAPPVAPAGPPLGGGPAGAAQRAANGQLPPLPGQEPARPSIAPPPPRPAVPMTAAPPLATPAEGTGLDFDRGSAVLTDADLRGVKAVSEIRGDRGIAITGYGDATASGARAQSDAVALGLSRAQAVATALVAQGVPYARLRMNAEAAGRGASLRLLQ
jgi:outer membrane protein OmpA-like peptidoglycan-associated protein